MSSFLLQNSRLGILYKNDTVVCGVCFFAERWTMMYLIFSLDRLKTDKKIAAHSLKNIHLGGCQEKKV